MIGFYLHVPFCARKCHYCNFVISTSQNPLDRGIFLSALEKEAERYRRRFEGVSFDTLYIGGGTPSVLSAEELGRLFEMIRRNYHLNADAEITLEANPGDLDVPKAQALRRMGVNRVSLGIQSFRERTLETANRSHGVQAAFGSFRALREAGFQNISLDLMLSMPGEALEDVRHSVEEAVALGPEHLSVYELTVEDRTVFGERRKKGTLALPAEELQKEMLVWTRDFLKRSGYEHYELLSYAKPGRRSRHNLIYWANGQYLGLGPGAFSYFDGRRFRIADTYESYIEKAQNDDWKALEDENLSGDKKDIESLLLALRLTEGADTERFSALLLKLDEPLRGLYEKELLEKKARFLRLTGRGQLFAETVFSELSSI